MSKTFCLLNPIVLYGIKAIGGPGRKIDVAKDGKPHSATYGQNSSKSVGLFSSYET